MTTMQALRINTVVSQEGVLTLRNISFHRGDPVEVIVLGEPRRHPGAHPLPLKGKVLRFDRPTDPIDEPWEAAR